MSLTLLRGPFAFVAITLWWGARLLAEPPVPHTTCERVVSLAPSITETLFALGLGEQVVGVTRYCTYPEGAAGKPKIGGFLDLNYEAVVRLQPTVVIALAEHRDQKNNLSRLGLNVQSIEHRSVKGILDSITLLGTMCGRETEGKALLHSLQEKMTHLTSTVRGSTEVRTLIVVGGGSMDGEIKSLYVSGEDGFYSELLRLAGGRNVYEGITASLPALSAEALLSLDPDVIIEIVTERNVTSLQRERALAAWKRFPQLRAVQADRIHFMDSDYVSVPGPRFVMLLEEMVKIVHPELSS